MNEFVRQVRNANALVNLLSLFCHIICVSELLARNYGTMKTAATTAAAIPGITFACLGRRAGGGSENPGEWATSNVVGIIWPLGWDRVNWPAKIWGWHETPASQAPTGLWGVNVTLSWKLCTFMLPLSEWERSSKLELKTFTTSWEWQKHILSISVSYH